MPCYNTREPCVWEVPHLSELSSEKKDALMRSAVSFSAHEFIQQRRSLTGHYGHDAEDGRVIPIARIGHSFHP